MSLKNMKWGILLTSTLFIGVHANADTSQWSAIFDRNEIRGTLVLKELGSKELFIYNETRANKRYVPASTFKILNTLISLQEKSINSIDDTLKWDGKERDLKAWNQNHTLRTAMPVSCVWCYQELARRNGKDAFVKWLKLSNYGNEEIGDKVDEFWLEGPLNISAIEQIEFIEKLAKNELPFDNSYQENTKEIMLGDSTKSYSLYAKTGWSQEIGWYVGFVINKAKTWIFALNMDMKDIDHGKYRKEITLEILKNEKIIP